MFETLGAGTKASLIMTFLSFSISDATFELQTVSGTGLGGNALGKYFFSQVI